MSEQICECRIDYADIEGKRVLPFIFSLNEEKSNLFPTHGKLQTFCYDIIGAGKENSKYADLDYFIFEVCSNINKCDIVNMTVTVDNKPQIVVWDKNVEVKTTENPDKATGGAGLKFNFPLDKHKGNMEVCFSLKKIYNVGPMKVYVYGEGVTAKGLKICGPTCEEKKECCDYVFHQKETVSVPVKVTPYAVTGTTKVNCCGKPIIKIGEQSVDAQCPLCKEACNFSISQNICIEIPVAFGADVEIGKTVIQCGEVTKPECGCCE